MDLENIILSEINQKRKINTVWYHLYVESKKCNKYYNKKEADTDTENKLRVPCEEEGLYRGGRVGGANCRVWDRLKDINCTIQETQPIACNKYKWKVTFKHYEKI